MNTKQQRFVDEYLIDHNATQAAIRAGYSKRTAGSIGEENLKKPEIKAAIDAGLEELRQRNAVTVDRVLAEYSKIAFADIKDFLEFKTVKTLLDQDDDGNPIYGYKNVVEVKPSDQVDGSIINEVSISRDGTFRFKLGSKEKALDALAKHLGMFIEKSEIDINGRIIVEFGIPRPSKDELWEDKDKVEVNETTLHETESHEGEK
nr:terminase small subunit [Phosphitispora fastidiosa]